MGNGISLNECSEISSKVEIMFDDGSVSTKNYGPNEACFITAFCEVRPWRCFKDNTFYVTTSGNARHSGTAERRTRPPANHRPAPAPSVNHTLSLLQRHPNTFQKSNSVSSLLQVNGSNIPPALADPGGTEVMASPKRWTREAKLCFGLP